MKRNVVIAMLFPVPLIVVGGVVGGVLYINHEHSNNASVLAASTGGVSMNALGSSQAQSIPLNEASSQSNASGSSGLQVDTSPETTHNAPSTMQQNQNNSNVPDTGRGSSSGAKSAPGPDTFAQYDQYKSGQHALFADIQVGTGTEVTNGTKVAVSYKGWLTNGTLFDESKADDKGQLQAFVVTIGEHKVIPGWEEGLLGMKVGGTRRLVIPPAVGYGENGQGPIPGGAVLVFDIQLLQAL